MDARRKFGEHPMRRASAFRVSILVLMDARRKCLEARNELCRSTVSILVLMDARRK